MLNGHSNELDAPNESIRVKVGTSEYEPRWGFLAEFILSEHGLTLQDVLEEANRRGKKTAAYSMQLLSACIAHHFPAGAVPSAAALAAQVGPGQFAPIWQGLMAAGRAIGAITDAPKNVQMPAPTETVQPA